MQVPSMHAVIVGSDMDKQTKFETELRHFVIEKKLQDCVHFVNKTLTVAPYLASIDVLVQNSQVGCTQVSNFCRRYLAGWSLFEKKNKKIKEQISVSQSCCGVYHG